MENQTQQSWNKVAQAYEDHFMDLLIYNSSYDDFLSKLSGSSPKVLEIGCGPGNISKYLLDKNPGIQLLGTDYAPDMVSHAQKNNPNGKFEVHDCREINSLQEKFDGIMIGFCLPYLNPSECFQLFRDCNALLEPNGVLYVSFVDGDESKSGLQTGSTGDSMYFHFHPKEKVQQQLVENGFEIVNQVEIAYPLADHTTQIHNVICAIKP